MIGIVTTMLACTCCGLKLRQLGRRNREHVLDSIVRMRNSDDKEQQSAEIRRLVENLESFNQKGYDVDILLGIVKRLA